MNDPMSSRICPECADYVGGPLVRDCKVCGGLGFLRDVPDELARGPILPMGKTGLPPEAVCQVCQKPGADAMAGIGLVQGVPVHLGCWLGLDDPGPGGAVFGPEAL